MFDHNTEREDAIPLTLIPDPLLRQKAKDVTDILGGDTQELIRKMFITMRVERGVGLAAPQVGINLRLAVINADGQKFTIINPEIIKTSPERILFPEGCLSIPGQEYSLIRHEKITVRYLDADGKQCKIKLKGFLAVVFQHEIDHLNGTLIVDRHASQEQSRSDFGINE